MLMHAGWDYSRGNQAKPSISSQNVQKHKYPNPSQKLLTQLPQKCLLTSFSESPVPDGINLGETLFCTAGIWTSKAYLESEV